MYLMLNSHYKQTTKDIHRNKPKNLNKNRHSGKSPEWRQYCDKSTPMSDGRTAPNINYTDWLTNRFSSHKSTNYTVLHIEVFYACLAKYARWRISPELCRDGFIMVGSRIVDCKFYKIITGNNIIGDIKLPVRTDPSVNIMPVNTQTGC